MSDRARSGGRELRRLLLVGSDTLEAVGVIVASRFDDGYTREGSRTRSNGVVGLIGFAVRRCGDSARDLEIRWEATAFRVASVCALYSID